MLTLGISTSSNHFILALGEGGRIIFNSNDYEPDKDIGAMMQLALEQTRYAAQDIQRIIVDNGPGGTSRVRTGVSFANSLAFSIGIGVCPVSFFELAGRLLWERHGLPAVCTINSLKGNAYMGLFDQGTLLPIRFGFIAEILPDMVASREAVVVAGPHSEKIAALFPDKKIVHDDHLADIAQVLITHGADYAERELKFPQLVLPLTEKHFLQHEDDIKHPVQHTR